MCLHVFLYCLLLLLRPVSKSCKFSRMILKWIRLIQEKISNWKWREWKKRSSSCIIMSLSGVGNCLLFFSLIWEIIFPLFLLTIYKNIFIVSVQMLHFEKALQVLVNLQVWWERRIIVRKGNSEICQHRSQSLLI